MRRAVGLLLLAIVAAGCADVVSDPPVPAEAWTEWRLEGDPSDCATCHYGVGDLWQRSWEPAGEGLWNLSVDQAYPDVPLPFIVVGQAPAADLAMYDPGIMQRELGLDDPWVESFDVGDGASVLFVEYSTESVITTVGPVGLQDISEGGFASTLTLTTPGGDMVEADGPERDRKFLLVHEPEPGTWTVTATIEQESGAGFLEVQVFGGRAVAPGETTTWPGLIPPEVGVVVRTEHDHEPFELGDTDHADGWTGQETGVSHAGTPPAAYEWTDDALAPFWPDEQVYVQRDRIVEWMRVYEEEHGTHKEDPNGPGSWPSYYIAADPIPPGTSKLVVDLVWDPPVEEPGWGLRLGPSGSPYYQEGELVLSEAGHAVFELAVIPEWWDVVLGDNGPEIGRGTLDIAPYVYRDDGAFVTTAYRGTLNAWAER